jgi:hypothetical protein
VRETRRQVGAAARAGAPQRSVADIFGVRPQQTL